MLGADLVRCDLLHPLYLGRLDGLSNDEARREFPLAARRMERWRHGELEARDLRLPGAENLRAFWSRGVSFLASLKHKEGLHAVVGTRSILTLLISILLGRDTGRGGGYVYVEVPCGGVVTFVLGDGAARVLGRLSNFRP
jgi:broad specificity phosphatase PhoE